MFYTVLHIKPYIILDIMPVSQIILKKYNEYRNNK